MPRIRDVGLFLTLIFAAIQGEFTIDLVSDQIRKAVVVRVNDTGECYAVSDIFPHSIVSAETSEVEETVDSTNRDIDTAFVSVYNVQTGELCDKQRKKLRASNPTVNGYSLNPTIHWLQIFSVCINCTDRSTPDLIRDRTNPSFRSYTATRRLTSFESVQNHNRTSSKAFLATANYISPYKDNPLAGVSIQLDGPLFVIQEEDDDIGSESGRKLKGLDNEIASYGIGNNGFSPPPSKLPADDTASRDPVTLGITTEVQPVDNIFRQAPNAALPVLPEVDEQTVDTLQVDMSCSIMLEECCEDRDCASANNVCEGRHCIRIGFPRITLSWEGDDDLDLYVMTPKGFTLSFVDDFDAATGGRLEATEEDESDFNVENVYFPLDGATPGDYTYYVRPLTTVDEADTWRVTLYDERGQVAEHNGSRFSPTYIYTRTDMPTTDTVPTPAPVEPVCDSTFDECCVDSDCLFFGEICVHRTCIDDGNPRITLQWTGDDDLDLFVETPNGDELSFMRFFDPLTGGRFGESVEQFGSGYHVENVFFSIAGAPPGTYRYFVRPLTTVGDADEWTLSVVDRGVVVASDSGVGVSPRFYYERQEGNPNQPPPTPRPNPPPTPFDETPAPLPNMSSPTPAIQPTPAPGDNPTPSPNPPSGECSVFFDECCEDTDCRTSRDMCIQRTCIREGNPRFTMIWTGNDDLELFVRTPNGVELSSMNTFDVFSGGRFEQDVDQSGFGRHVENIYFPILGTGTGTFVYGMRTVATRVEPDFWSIEVYDDRRLLFQHDGNDRTASFSYDRDEEFEGPQRPRPSPPRCSPISDECCLDSDCTQEGEICVQRTCIDEGNPRFTLSWVGDDDLDIFVETPDGVIISRSSPVDVDSGGRYGEDPLQSEFGFHVENIFFPMFGAPTGTYKFFVQSVAARGVGADIWRIRIYENGDEVLEQVGIGDSREFIYERTMGTTISPAPTIVPRPTPAPIPGGVCIPSDDVCCAQTDCVIENEICANRNCVMDGNPRFTLTWTGDDDYDLLVEPPAGSTIFFGNRFDAVSGGQFGGEAIQAVEGFYAENVFFPRVNNLFGPYRGTVRLATRRGTGDAWTLRVFDGGVEVLRQTGIGDFGPLTYVRMGGQTPNPAFPPSPAFTPSPAFPVPTPSPAFPSAPFPFFTPPPVPTPSPAFPTPVNPPVLSPITERPPIEVPPTPPRTCPDECCTDADCGLPGQFCVQRTCIFDGTPRITLTWTGNDELELFVVTPDGRAISNLAPVDDASGGSFSQDANPNEFGFHVQNIIFPFRGGPSGTYSYFVKSSRIVTLEDRWALRVYIFGQLVRWNTGSGESRTFTYTFGGGVAPPTPQPAGPPLPPVPTLPPAFTFPPTRAGPEICVLDADCSLGEEICVQRQCIDEGTPRFTLIWSGNDDLDIFVQTPDGVLISRDNQFDGISGGIFGEPPTQTGFGFHVENIYFPQTGGPRGTYTYYVRSSRMQGGDDSWQLGVFVDGQQVAVQQGMGDSEFFIFEYLVNVPTPSPTLPECSTDVDCPEGQVCVLETCIFDGNPRVTLSWTGDDDLNLVVVTPDGDPVSGMFPVDFTSGGRFQGNAFQTTFGGHVENVYFPLAGGPNGRYLYFVMASEIRGETDTWTLRVYINGQEIAVRSGLGTSASFTFDFGEVLDPTPSPLPEPVCNPSMVECCADADCIFGNEACVQRFCVNEGNPRFTLSWTGNDDLDLLVITPLGTVISFANTEDAESGGIFGEPGDQFDTGRHVENIYFPINGGPVGLYQIFVRTFLTTGIDDLWTVRVFVNGEQVSSATGRGDSDGLTYEFLGLPQTDNPTPQPAAPTPPPTVSPTPLPESCVISQEACCTDGQCITAVETCVQRTCIEAGTLRFTLVWTGDDDIDIQVVTPLETRISFIEPIDSRTGGIYGEEGTQFEFGRHVENIYWPLDREAPRGIYTYTIQSFVPRETMDQWTATVYVNNVEVESRTGVGTSTNFEFNFQDEVMETAQLAAPDMVCTLFDSKTDCCDDSQCDVATELCVQRTCIKRGNPRFTLTWTGDDDLDLSVVTPFGTTVALSHLSDEMSGGIFGQPGDQLEYGHHVENIYFPVLATEAGTIGGPVGTYTYFVSNFDPVGLPDTWAVAVYVNDVEVASQTGTGTSDFLMYDFDGTIDSSIVADAGGGSTFSSKSNNQLPSFIETVAQNSVISSPSSGTVNMLFCNNTLEECCRTTDCPTHQLCIQRKCIDEGNPRFTLTWNGDDDYDLTVIASMGDEISFINPSDEDSGGRFGEDGIQSFPGLHVENVYFPLNGGPIGTYAYQISVFDDHQGTGGEDTWTVRVFVDGIMVESHSGIGNSETFQYEYTRGSNLAPNVVPECSLELYQCCVDADCPTSHPTSSGAGSVSSEERCIQRTCIVSYGIPRFTLTWTGDDDYDLYVLLPNGNEVSYYIKRSGNAFFGQSARGNNDNYVTSFGPHVENIYVTSDEDELKQKKDYDITDVSPSPGRNDKNNKYRYYISTFNQIGTSDEWTVEVFVKDDNIPIQSYTGKGNSPYFEFELPALQE